jgi:hypothetical protein
MSIISLALFSNNELYSQVDMPLIDEDLMAKKSSAVSAIDDALKYIDPEALEPYREEISQVIVTNLSGLSGEGEISMKFQKFSDLTCHRYDGSSISVILGLCQGIL